MKTVNKNTDEFKPFTIELQIDSIDDLRWLWAMANTSYDTASEQSESSPVGGLAESTEYSSTQMRFFDIIDNVARQYKEHKNG